MFSLHVVLRTWLHKLAVAIVAASAAISASAEPSQGPGYAASGGTMTFTLDVAENFDLFETSSLHLTSELLDAEPLFITYGSIYPAGTIKAGGRDFHPDAPGSIGRWSCRGARIAPARLLPPIDDFKVRTLQLYLFPDETRAIATEGMNDDVTDMRAILHATGMYRGYAGEQSQEFLGYNATGGVNLRVTFTLEKRK